MAGSTDGIAGRILASRFLTRSGDQAWDFAVPLVLLKILPDQLRVAAFYYLAVKLANVILLPRLSAVIDRARRQSTAKLGITIQFFGVAIGAGALYWLSSGKEFGSHDMPVPALAFVILITGGVLASLGSSFMEIAIANDLVPSSFGAEELTSFNARLRQVDLLTEVTAPILAGLLLLIEWPGNPLFGFYLVALWNLVSFFPEYGLLSSIFRMRPDLNSKQVSIAESVKTPFLRKLTVGWRAFFNEPVAPAMIAYALLWLSALSPHGVLLTAFLKDGWRLPEWGIGLFRGAGALFGLASTIVFPKVVARFGLIRGSKILLMFQAITVLIAGASFLLPGTTGQVGFLVFILFSRIGLYGFSLGEMQIRQTGISSEVRGQVNGFASALTGVATLALYGAGTLLPSTQDFYILLVLSVASVVFAATVFASWARRNGAKL